MVSIIVPCYNQGEFLNESLLSVKQQSYHDWECLIIDDGSTDITQLIAEKWVSKDPRYKYFKKSNGGLSSARNYGMCKAKGDFYQFLDCDDVLLPDKLRLQVNKMKMIKGFRDNAVAVCPYIQGDHNEIWKTSNPPINTIFNSNNFLNELITHWESNLSIACHAFIFSASIFRKNNILFDETLPNHEDIDCWLKIFSLDIELIQDDQPLVIYRKNNNSMSKNQRRMGEGYIAVLDKHLKREDISHNHKRLIEKKRIAVILAYKKFDLLNNFEKLKNWQALFHYKKNRLAKKYFN